VTLAGRNPEKGARAVEAIRSVTAGADIRFQQVDLASLRSIESAAGRFLEEGRAIDILLNNAGIMSPPMRRETEDGFEAQFGTNHLGHFALTARLLPLLRQSKAARVVNVTSIAHRYGGIRFDDLQSRQRYKAGVAYCQSKLAVAIFALHLQRLSERKGWTFQSMAVHPGFAGTNLFAAEQGSSALMTMISEKLLVPLIGQSASEGARPLVYGALSSDARGGHLYGPTGRFEMRGPPGECKFAKTALEDETAERLWRVSEELCGLKFG